MQELHQKNFKRYANNFLCLTTSDGFEEISCKKDASEALPLSGQNTDTWQAPVNGLKPAT